MSGRCPESRCTFTTDRAEENQAAADAVIFHMPNLHWDRWKHMFVHWAGRSCCASLSSAKYY